MDRKDPRDRLLCPKNNILVKYRAHKRDAVCNHDSCNQEDYSNLDNSLFLFVIHLIHLPFGSSHCTGYAASAGYIHGFRQDKRIQVYL